MEYSNYHRIYNCDLSNGEGVRVTLFLSGCDHGCKGCYNTSTWDPDSGLKLDEETIKKLLADCATHTGLSLSGGDPLHISNRSTVLRIVREFKQLYPTKNIWMWTGYKFDDIKNEPTIDEILKYVDVVIDGKYEQGNPARQDQPWRGSANQNLIHIAKI